MSKGEDLTDEELSEYANQCNDEHEIEINLAIKRYGLDKELFYTNEQKRATAEFTLGREVRAKAKSVIEMLAGKRMSDKEMRKSLESKKRRTKTNIENAKKPRKNKPTKAELVDFRDKWIYEHGISYGWRKSACDYYECSRTTISKIYNEKEEK